MTNNFLNHSLLDDDGGGSQLAPGVARIVGAILLLISAATSFAFFAQYAGKVFEFISPSLSPYLAGAVGVISFELMSVVWRYLHANNADTARQMQLAQVGAILALSGGLLVTVIYFALQTDLLTGVMDASTVTALSLVGGILIILGVSGNFGLYHFYEEAGSKHQANLQKAQIAAMRSTASFHTKAATTKHTLAHTMNEIDRALPGQAAQQARRERDQWATTMFTPMQNRKSPAKNPNDLQPDSANSEKSDENSKQNAYSEASARRDNGQRPK